MLGTMTIFTPFSKLISHLMAVFIHHKPTGRFCNGKLATDITADAMGFTAYPLTYLSPQALGKNLLIGSNFASTGSSYDDKTVFLSVRILACACNKVCEKLANFNSNQPKLLGLLVWMDWIRADCNRMDG